MWYVQNGSFWSEMNKSQTETNRETELMFFFRFICTEILKKLFGFFKEFKLTDLEENLSKFYLNLFKNK